MTEVTVKNGRNVTVRVLKLAVRVLVVAALMSVLLHWFWGCMHWSGFVASAGLSHVTIVDGARHCDFSQGESAGSSIEWLCGLSANWKTEQFKEAVANRLFSLGVIKEDKDALLRILNAVKFEIRPERSCVRIIAVAKSGMLAAECANGVADEIVRQLADENRRCKSIGCSQITRIRKRQQMLVRKIEDSLRGQNEDQLVNNKVRFTIDDLNRELEVLDQMKENEAKVSSVDAWNGVFERVDDAYENVHPLQPNLAIVGLISLFLSIMLEALLNFNRFFYICTPLVGTEWGQSRSGSGTVPIGCSDTRRIVRNGRALVISVCGVVALVASFAIYYCCVGFVYKESLQFTYALPCGQVKDTGGVDDGLLKKERVSRRQETIRALADCFGDWKFESHTRSRPFYKKVVERVVERHEVADAGVLEEKINCILKDAQFEVVKGPNDALPVTALIILKSKDAQLLKETAAVYKDCVLEYAEDENRKREERAVSPLRGEYNALQDEVKGLNKRASDQILSGNQKTLLLKRKAELKERLAKLEGEMAEAEKIARKCERVISFFPDTLGAGTSGNH